MDINQICIFEDAACCGDMVLFVDSYYDTAYLDYWLFRRTMMTSVKSQQGPAYICQTKQPKNEKQSLLQP